MHYECLYTMKKFIRRYLDGRDRLRVLEVGSLDVSPPEKNLRFRRYFDRPGWEYTGLDVVAGNNVDVVADDPYRYPFPDNHFDVVISGNTLEHVKDLHKIIREMARITGDLVCVIVPNCRGLHNDPIDCWRIFPDGMRFLLGEVAGLEVLECRMAGGKELFDTIGVGKKYGKNRHRNDDVEPVRTAEKVA